MFPLQEATDPNVYGPLSRAIAAFLGKYWWVGVVVIAVWYLRWYGKAWRSDDGGAPVLAAQAFLKDVYLTVRRGASLIGITVIALIIGLAWVFNIIPVLFAGLGAGDPIVWATTAAAGIAGSAALDLSWGTPMNTFWAFLITLGVILGLETLGNLAQGTAQEADTDDDNPGNRTGWAPSGFPGVGGDDD